MKSEHDPKTNGARAVSPELAEVRRVGREMDFDLDLRTGRTLDCIADADIEPEAVDWIWPGRIAAGKLVLLEGDPDLGKSLLTMTLATSLSLGIPLPGGPTLPLMNTLLISGEDDPRDTTTPRLIASGADRSRLFHVRGTQDGQPFTLRDSNLELHRTIVQYDAQFVVIDPLMAFLPQGIDSHNDGDIRTLLRPISEIAEDTGAAIMAVRHLKKGASSKAIMAGAGALSALAAARLVLSVWEDPQNPVRRLLAVTKCNIGPKMPTLAYRIGIAPTAFNDQPVVYWDGESTATANELSASRDTVGETTNARIDAEEFLRGAIGLTGMFKRDVMRMAKGEGFSERTIERAANRIGVIFTRKGVGKEHGSYWEMPAKKERSPYKGYPDSLDEPLDEGYVP